MRARLLFSTLLVLPLLAGAAKQATLVDEARAKLVVAAALDERPGAALRLQVLLDRQGYSVGEIDAAPGDKTVKALRAFQAAKGLEPSGVVDGKTLAALDDGRDVLVKAAVPKEDVAGPFAKVPGDMMERAKAKRLGWESALEAFAERHQASPALIEKLNPGALPLQAGEELLVPDVASRQVAGKASRVVVREALLEVVVYGAGDAVLARYPASIGGEADRLPQGTFTVTSVVEDPPFEYDPKLFWDAPKDHEKASIAPGPNGPVGKWWIGISKEHLGIHGTGHPAEIGEAQTHGCVRLTNWDAAELASLVAKGTPVVLEN